MDYQRALDDLYLKELLYREKIRRLIIHSWDVSSRRNWKKKGNIVKRTIIRLSSIVTLFLAFVLFSASIAYAEDGAGISSLVESTLVRDSTFDLEALPHEGETKTVRDKNGEETHFSVIPENSNLNRIANGRYRISAWGIGWRVTYYIRVVNNRILSAYDLNYIIAMPIRSSNVKVDHSRQATVRFGFNTPIHNVLSWTGWVRVRLDNSNRIVVYNN